MEFENPFVEPEVIWIGSERIWQGNKTRIQLERGDFRGQPTLMLRLTYCAPDGVWRWAAAKPTRFGRGWASLSIRRSELAGLAAALAAEALAAALTKVAAEALAAAFIKAVAEALAAALTKVGCADVAKNVNNCKQPLPSPTHESHARELALLPPAQPSGKQARKPNAREQAALNSFDAQHPIPKGTDDCPF